MIIEIGDDAQVEDFPTSDRISKIIGYISNAINQDDKVTYSQSIDFHFVNKKSNLHMCAECGRILTAFNRKNPIPGLPIGWITKGKAYHDLCGSGRINGKDEGSA